MRKFNISVNGKSYSVEVEEVSGAVTSNAPVVVPTPVVATVAKAVAPVAVSAPITKPTTVGNGTPVNSPLPGVIVKISVANGQKVKKGECLLVLEAMKMENDVAATADGIVTISVAKGAQVNTGDILATIA